MCIAAVLFSLIPILSGYAVYLVFSTVITKGSPALQWTVGLPLVAVLVWALAWAAQRIRRRAVVQAALDGADVEGADVPPPPVFPAPSRLRLETPPDLHKLLATRYNP